MGKCCGGILFRRTKCAIGEGCGAILPGDVSRPRILVNLRDRHMVETLEAWLRISMESATESDCLGAQFSPRRCSRDGDESLWRSQRGPTGSRAIWQRSGADRIHYHHGL